MLGGYLIPTQTSVIVDVHNLNRRSPVWGDDGDTFRPDRFANLQPMQYRYAYLRFGFGPRECSSYLAACEVSNAENELRRQMCWSTLWRQDREEHSNWGYRTV